MTERVYNVLFLRTGNSARSIIAECVLNRLGKGRFNAYSAGSFPKGKVNPYALRLLTRQDYSTADLRSKSWDEFARPGAPQMDFVFTVCDNAANEVCPVWPSQPMTAQLGHSRSRGSGGHRTAKEPGIHGHIADADESNRHFCQSSVGEDRPVESAQEAR